MDECRKQFEELLSNYWEIAYKEGRLQLSNGDAANEVLHNLRVVYRNAKAAGMREAAKMVEEMGYSYVAGEILKAADRVEAGV